MDIAYIIDIITSHGDYEKSQLRILALHLTFHKNQNVWSMRNQIVSERVSWENGNLHQCHLLHHKSGKKVVVHPRTLLLLSLL